MSKTPPKTASLEDTAADWLLRSDRGLSPQEKRDLAGWLAAEPRHEAAFLAMEETWHRLAAAPVGPLLAPPARPRFRWRLPLSLAAAAAIAFAAVAGWHIWRSDWAPYALTAQTEIGGFREIVLPDGSVARLNTDSQLSISYTRHERRIALTRGEAHFSVAKNPARPFIVSAAGLEVRAVGTAFNVRLKSTTLEVLVTEGRVNLAERSEQGAGNRGAGADSGDPGYTLRASGSTLRASHARFLTAGERVTVNLAGGPVAEPLSAPVVATIRPDAVRQALSWQEKRLDFDGTPLGQMIDEINRYSREKLVIDDPSLGAERFGGSFPAGDTDTVVRMLVKNFDVVAERSGDTTVLRFRHTRSAH